MPLHPLTLVLRRELRSLGLREGEAVLVAVSGGPDSLALLHLLAELRPLFPLRISAACIDHGLRPLETPAEWALVQENCARLGLPCLRKTVDVRTEAAQRKISLEHAARDLRYQALEEAQREQDAQWLALAHTADDQAEELLLKLLRGSGRRALAGMRRRTGNRIRPLLGLRKQDLLDYLVAKGQAFCVDSSNQNTDILRNRIRLRLLPLLEREYDPGIRAALLKTADNLAVDEDFLEAQQESAWKALVQRSGEEPAPVWILDLPGFCRLHPALQRRLLERLLYTAQGKASYEHILALVRLAGPGDNGRELHLHRGLRVLRQRETLVFTFPWGRGPCRCSGKPGGC